MADVFDLSTPVTISNPYQKLFGLHGIGTRTGPTIAATRIESKHIPISKLYHSESGLPTDGKSGRSVLSFLCQKGWLELVRAMLEIGSIIDSTDKQGRIPLSYAAEFGHSSIVEILMEAGALSITEDASRRSPLSYASGNGHVTVMDKLMSDSRVKTDSRDMQNRSPLHWAAKNCHKDAVEWLIDHGAEANAKDIQNRSPLHWAAENGDCDAIRCLVNSRARVDDVDSNEYTPLLVALLNPSRSRFSRKQTADLLVQMKAKLDLTIQDKELWEWALENGGFVCAEYVLENHPRTDIGVMVCIATPPFCLGEDRDNLFPLLPNFQSGFKLRVFYDHIEEEEIKLETRLGVVEGKLSIDILRVSGGSHEWTGQVLKVFNIINMFLDGLQDPDAIEKLAKAAVTNGIDGKEIISKICDRYESQFQATEDVVEAALTN
ncbi:ankyrin repeat-containing domain protein [Trichoderma velutinum]